MEISNTCLRPNMRTRWLMDKKRTPLSFRHRHSGFTMSSQPYKELKKRKRTTMWLDEDVDAAEMITYEEVEVIGKGGRRTTKRVAVPLFPAQIAQGMPSDSSHHPVDAITNDIDMLDAFPDSTPNAEPTAEPRRSKVRRQKPDWIHANSSIRPRGTIYWNSCRTLTRSSPLYLAGKLCQMTALNVLCVPETTGRFGDAKTVVWPNPYVGNACVQHIMTIRCIK